MCPLCQKTVVPHFPNIRDDRESLSWSPEKLREQLEICDFACPTSVMSVYPWSTSHYRRQSMQISLLIPPFIVIWLQRERVLQAYSLPNELITECREDATLEDAIKLTERLQGLKVFR